VRGDAVILGRGIQVPGVDVESGDGRGEAGTSWLDVQ
jgi:hypothetical protein